MTNHEPQFELTWVKDRAGNETGKVVFPKLPDANDLAGNCEWLTVVFNFDSAHPIIGGELLGVEGSDVGVRLFRKQAHDEDLPDLLFRDAKQIYRTTMLVPMLGFSRIATDGVVPTYTNANCAQIAEAVRRVATTNNTITEQDQIIGVITSLIERSEVKEEFTIWGDQAARYEAVVALQREPHLTYPRPVCLIDRIKRDHYVIGADDFQQALRRELGPQRHGGWKLAAELVGWRHFTLQGKGLPGTDGFRPHRRRQVVTGTLPEFPDEDDAPEEYDPALLRKIPGKHRKRRRK